MDQKRIVWAMGAALVGVLGWSLVAIVDDLYERLQYLRDAHVRHIEWHQERSQEQPSVWRSR